MPNRPITAIRKSKPLSNRFEAEGQAQLPGHLVETDRAEREAEHHRAMVLNGGSLLSPTKLQNARK